MGVIYSCREISVGCNNKSPNPIAHDSLVDEPSNKTAFVFIEKYTAKTMRSSQSSFVRNAKHPSNNTNNNAGKYSAIKQAYCTVSVREKEE
ncbi:hypothetical protein ACFXTH_000662 [Malus domestica]